MVVQCARRDFGQGKRDVDQVSREGVSLNRSGLCCCQKVTTGSLRMMNFFVVPLFVEVFVDVTLAIVVSNADDDCSRSSFDST